MKLDSYILVKAEDESKLFEAVLELADLYVETEFTDEIIIKSINGENDQYILVFPNNPDFERFKYFVNYLHYPESVGFEIETKGYWTINKGDDIPEEFLGSRAMLFISKCDTEYDNVFCVFDSASENYKLGFARGEEFVRLEAAEVSFFEKEVSESSLKSVKVIVPNKELLEKRNNLKGRGTGCLKLLPIFLILSIAFVWLTL